MYGYIYKTTCLVNDKIYIGKKKSDKFLGTKYLGSGVALKNAIKKYGKDKFTVELLCECDSIESLNANEIEYIKKFNARDCNIGYNISSGGDGFGDTPFIGGMTGKHQSDYQKQRAREYWKGRSRSIESRLKMSKSHLGISHESKTKGYKAINLGYIGSTILVPPESVDDYLKQGYMLGEYRNKPDFKEIYSNGEYMYKDTCNGRVVEFINNDDIINKLLDGYDFGKKPKNEYKSSKGKDYSKIKSYYLNLINSTL